MSAFEINNEAAPEGSNKKGAAGECKTKGKLPAYPVSRRLSEVRRWYKEVRQAAVYAGWGPALLLNEKALGDMSHREMAVCMQLAAALYDCMSSDSERKEFRDELAVSEDEEHTRSMARCSCGPCRCVRLTTLPCNSKELWKRC